MKSILSLLLVIGQPSFAAETLLDFIVPDEMQAAKEAIRASYRGEGISDTVIGRIELELFSLSTVDVEGTVPNEKVTLDVGIYSSYVRDEGSGVSDICTVKFENSRETRRFWKIQSVGCETYD